MRLWITLAVLVLSTAVARADDVLDRIEVRVTAVLGKVVHIDRGQATGMQPGDRVVFHPYGADRVEGTVLAVDDRTARVSLRDVSVTLDIGTPGEVWVTKPAVDPEVGQDPDIPDHPPWSNVEEEWRQDMPLLAEVKSPGPEERPSRFSGRLYTMLEYTDDSQFDRSDSFFRTGADLLYENPFGQGGRLNFDAEWNHRETDVPDGDDESESNLRIDRLSYAWGGGRHSAGGWEAGRFLQNEFPEFGVLDGVEYGRRMENGDRWGASVGFIPEPDADFESGDDFQMAAFYRHVQGEREEFSVGLGVQKTWHEGTSDRDLLLANIRYSPPTGWNAYGNAWVDFYGSEDTAKGSGPELTQLNSLVGYRWEGGDGVQMSYSRIRFPELLRSEFLPVTAEQIADNQTDRIAISGWRRVGRDVRLHGRVDHWTDQDGSGSGGEVRVDVNDLFVGRSRSGLSIFGNEGRFSSVIGTRLSFGRTTNWGLWNLSWEIAKHENDSFSGDQEKLLQHRLRGSWDFHSQGGWSWSLFSNYRFGDEQDSQTLGVFLQKSF